MSDGDKFLVFLAWFFTFSSGIVFASSAFAFRQAEYVSAVIMLAGGFIIGGFSYLDLQTRLSSQIVSSQSSSQSTEEKSGREVIEVEIK